MSLGLTERKTDLIETPERTDGYRSPCCAIEFNRSEEDYSFHILLFFFQFFEPIFYLLSRITMRQSRFSQRHKIDNIGIIANFVIPHICSSLLYLHRLVKVNVK